jgi:murein tripeptide amidase MpaA
MSKIIALSFILCTIIASYSAYQSDMGLQVSNIDTDIESGSGTHFGRSNVNEFTYLLEYDVNASICHWFHFKLENASDQEVTFRILNYAESMFGYNSLMKPVYSYDTENWSHIDNVRIRSAFTFTQKFEQDTVWIASSIPYKYSELEEYLELIEELPYVERETLGSSSDGHRLEILTITDQSTAPESKQTVWITTGHHGSETSGMWVVRGMIDHILSNPGLRRNYVWKINPMMNPDGVVEGYTRYDSDGRDLNREWDDGLEMEPEIALVNEAMQEWLDENEIDLLADFHSSSSYHPYAIILPEGYAYPEYSNKQKSLLANIQEYTDYDEVQKTTTQGTARVEMFDLQDVLSITLEMPVNSLTKEYCMKQGALIAQSFDSFLKDEQLNPN